MTLTTHNCQPPAEMQPTSRPSNAVSSARFCDGCGHANRVEARFCARCGADLPEPADAAPLEHARTLCAKGDRLQAQTVLETALALDPSNDALRLSYATLLLQTGEWEVGLAQLRQLSPSAGTTPVVQAYVGGALLGLSRVSEAKDILDAAFVEWPTDFYVLLKRGELYCRLGIYQTAVQALEQASRADVDPASRDAIRRLLRFAREKNRSGFIRSFPARVSAWSFKSRLRLGKQGAGTVWGM